MFIPVFKNSLYLENNLEFGKSLLESTLSYKSEVGASTPLIFAVCTVAM